MVKTLEKIYYDPNSSACYAGSLPLIGKTKNKVNPRKTKEWLLTQDAYTLHTPRRKHFPMNKYIVSNIDDLWQADLAVLKNLTRHNQSVKYLLVVVDVFSKYGWLRPLKNKTAKAVNEAFASIFEADGRKPHNLQCDKGREFVSTASTSFFKKHDINFYTTRNPDTKAAVVERFLKTVKTRLWRYFTHKNTYRYVDVIQALANAYNNTVHSSIKMAPAKVNDKNVLQVWKNLYSKEESYITPKLKVGDTVRLAKEKKHFAKGYESNWTSEIFKVVRVIRHPIPVYEVADTAGEVIDGTFYESELQKVIVPKSKVRQIEKVLKMKGSGKSKKVLVKWKGYPAKFNSWIPASNILDLTQ
jgi:hypothetical protein